jgi:hypothetical protein
MAESLGGALPVQFTMWGLTFQYANDGQRTNNGQYIYSKPGRFYETPEFIHDPSQLAEIVVYYRGPELSGVQKGMYWYPNFDGFVNVVNAPGEQGFWSQLWRLFFPPPKWHEVHMRAEHLNDANRGFDQLMAGELKPAD